MDRSRLLEHRYTRTYRFTYCCEENQIRALKIIAADLGIPVNKLIHRALIKYIQSKYTQKECLSLLAMKGRQP